MGWKQTRPSCYTYAPLRSHDQIVSPPLSIEVKNEWSHTPLLPLHAFMAWTGKTSPLAVQLSKSAS